MAQQQKLPFRRNTRQRRRMVQTPQALSGLAATANFTLDRVGLLNYLIVVVRATVNLSAAGALASLGPWSLIDRIRVDLNLGNTNLVDISGWQLAQIAKKMYRTFALDGGATAAGAGPYAPHPLTYQAPVASGNNSWIIPLFIPISANPGSQFDSGLVSLQSPEVVCTVQARLTAAGANFVTNFNTISNVTCELYQCYYEYPDPSQVLLPPGQIVRTVEFSAPIVAAGADTIYTIERQGVLLNLNSTVIINGTRSDAVDYVRLNANINDSIYDEPTFLNKFMYQFNQSIGVDTGIFDLDLWHAGELPSCYDDRDVIDTEVLTTLQWIARVTAGTSLGSGNNFFNTARRVLVNFAQPTPGPAV